MKHRDLIIQAIKVHFAICNNQMSCDTQLEDSANIAKDFMEYYLNGRRSDGFEKAMKTTRGQVKKQLIERYINNTLS